MATLGGPVYVVNIEMNCAVAKDDDKWAAGRCGVHEPPRPMPRSLARRTSGLQTGNGVFTLLSVGTWIATEHSGTLMSNPRFYDARQRERRNGEGQRGVRYHVVEPSGSWVSFEPGLDISCLTRHCIIDSMPTRRRATWSCLVFAWLATVTRCVIPRGQDEEEE